MMILLMHFGILLNMQDEIVKLEKSNVRKQEIVGISQKNVIIGWMGQGID